MIFEVIILKQKQRISTKVTLILWWFWEKQTSTYFLEVSVGLSLKVATNGSFRSRETSKIKTFEAIILKQKWRSATKVIYFLMMILECTSFRGACFLEMSGHISLKLATNGSFRGNES